MSNKALIDAALEGQKLSMDNFTRAYIECALWSEQEQLEEDARLNHHDDMGLSMEDIAPATLGKMIADCAKFQLENHAALKMAYNLHDSSEHPDDYTESQAGHDFWLTRNGHGAGFWDRGLQQAGDALTVAAKAYGNIDLYIGDDGMIYG